MEKPYLQIMNTKTKLILISSIVGLAVALSASGASVLFPTGGGTGTSTKPTAGQVLVGQSSGIYAPQATSTLGITSSQWTTTSTGIFYNGNVGLGTSVLSYPLTVNGTSSQTRILLGDGDQGAPSLSFLSEPNLGLHRQASGVLDLDATTQIRFDLGNQATILNFTTTDFAPTPDGTVNLGTSTARFKDLNMSGTAVIGTLNGILKGTSGTLGIATAGTDYVSTTTGNWIGTFQNKNSTDFLSSSTTYVATESDPIVKAQNGIITSNGSTISSTANNSSNWDTAYTDRLKWDGGSTGLTASTGRTSLGLTDTATIASTTWAKVANNLSDLQSTSTARTNLGVDVTKATNIKTIGFNVFNATTTSTATTTVQRQFYQASTLSLVSCSTNGSNITISVEKRASSTPDTAGTSMLASLVCGSGGNSTSTFATSTIAENQVLTFLLTSVPNSTTTLRTYTKFLND